VEHDPVIALLILVIAALYGSVGHAGASGYIAVLALCGLAPDSIKPTALCLNVVVATVAALTFARAGWFRWRLLWPFALASIPCAFLGGMARLSPQVYRIALACVLCYAGWRLWMAGRTPSGTEETTCPPAVPVALVMGGGIGLASGMIGVGGGIFLSPLLILLGWAGSRTAAAVSAAFILVNSLAGLAGHGVSVGRLPSDLPAWLGCALVGGALGSWLGSARLPALAMRRLLAGVLVAAAFKLAV
jgi:uncharacterized membrane protein YfcA